MPKITVIIRSYNRPETLERAIKSVIEQSYQDWEAIISDDCSTDNRVKEIIDKYIHSDSRIKAIIQPKNQGFVSRGTNDAMDMAKGEYVSFLDDDNFYHPDFLKDLLQFAIDGDYDMVYCLSERVGLDGSQKGLWGHGKGARFDLNQLRQGNYIDSNEVLLKRQIGSQLLYFKEDLDTLEDWDMWLRIAERGNIGFYPEKRCYYAVHSEQRVNQTLDKNEKNILKIIADRENRLKRKQNILVIVPEDSKQTDSQRDMKRHFLKGLAEVRSGDEIKIVTEKSIWNINIDDYNPDYTITFQPFLHPANVHQLVKGRITIAIMNEDPYAFGSVNLPFSKYYQWVMTNDEGCMETYNNHGRKTVVFPSLSISPENHKIYLKSCLDEKYLSDIVMVGYPYPERVNFLNAVNGFCKDRKCLCVGSDFEKFRTLVPDWNIIPETVSPDEMMKYYCGSKIILCINRIFMGSPQTLARGFIEAWSGQMVMMDNRRKTEDYFNGDEMVIFNTAKDFIEKAEYYLEHEEERKKIARRGAKRAANYTFEKRIKKIFQLVEADRFDVII